jgi:hypothetical protein
VSATTSVPIVQMIRAIILSLLDEVYGSLAARAMAWRQLIEF